MDLGKAKLPRTGLNLLHHAIHPVHGIAWTDGRQVSLTSFVFANGELTFGDTNVIGHFEHVLGLYWGPLCCSGTPALLAVQHEKNVSVWQLQLSLLECNKLLCTQACEMSEPFPLLPRGCVWHPKADVLAVLTKRDVSVLFSVRVDNRRVKASVKASGPIRCGCWTKDGTRLVVAVGSTLHSYIWNDVEKTLVACTFCAIFDVGGNVCSMESTEGSLVAVATELPLDKICGLNAGMEFDVLPEVECPSPRSPVLVLNDDSHLYSRRRSVESEKLGHVSLPSSGPIDLTHLLTKHRNSDPSPLIHLRRRDHLTGSGQDSSHLILVRYERQVTTTRKVSVPGILVPDMIVYHPRGSVVAVASNTSPAVLVYRVTDSAIPNIQQVQLEKHERPKGVCFLSDSMLLLMVGRPKSHDSTFLTSSNTDKYNIRLMIKELANEKDSSRLAAQDRDSGLSTPGDRRSSESFAKNELPGLKELMLPAGYVIQVPSNRKKLVEEVKNTGPSLTDIPDRVASSKTMKNCDVECDRRLVGLSMNGQSRECGRPSSPRFDEIEKPHSDLVSPDNGCPAERLRWNLESIFSRISEVQQHLSEIPGFSLNRKKLAGPYPSAMEPPFVDVTFQKQISESASVNESRRVLLCDGKLRLRVLQDLFGSSMVEMMHGTSWIVLVEDADGFVPLTFEPEDKLTVRNAKQPPVPRPPRDIEGSTPQSPCGLSPHL